MSEQPLLSLIVAFTLTAVVVFAVSVMAAAPFRTTFVTVGAEFPMTTVVLAFVAAKASGTRIPPPTDQDATSTATVPVRKTATISVAPICKKIVRAVMRQVKKSGSLSEESII